MPPTQAPLKNVLLRLACVILPAGVLLPLTYFFPPIDLTGPIAQSAYWIAASGGTVGIPLIGFTMTALLVSRPGHSGKQRAAEAVAIVLALATFLGVGAYLNEHLVKPIFAVPRPNIIELAETTHAALKMSAEEFYATMSTKAERSAYLTSVLTAEFELPMDDYVRRHWIHESGYSFPSGHSFSAMLVATGFLALGLSYLSRARLWVFYVLVAWALAVCYSRPILRVHSPTDVCVGGLEGIVFGVLAFLLIRGILKCTSPETVPTNPSSVHG